MNDQQIREKYHLNGKRHAVILFIQMILVILGIGICAAEALSGSPNYIISIDMLIIFLVVVGYAVYGYKFPVISVQASLILIVIIDLVSLFLVHSTQQGEPGNVFLVLLINLLLAAAAVFMKKDYKVSQVMLLICLVIDIAQFVIKVVQSPQEPLIFYLMSFQFIIMEATLMLINYSFHEREKNRALKA